MFRVNNKDTRTRSLTSFFNANVKHICHPFLELLLLTLNRKLLAGQNYIFVAYSCAANEMKDFSLFHSPKKVF